MQLIALSPSPLLIFLWTSLPSYQLFVFVPVRTVLCTQLFTQPSASSALLAADIRDRNPLLGRRTFYDFQSLSFPHGLGACTSGCETLRLTHKMGVQYSVCLAGLARPK